MGRLIEAAAAEPPRRLTGPACGIVTARKQVDEDDLELFDDLVAEVMVGARTAASLSRVLARVDVNLKADRITYHVRGECQCPKHEASS